jgi:hypothetical protein
MPAAAPPGAPIAGAPIEELPESTSWAFKPILGPLSPTDIMAIAGAALGPLSMGGVGQYKYKPFLPLQATGALLEDKQAQLYQQLAEQQQGQAVRGLIAPLYSKAAGQDLPPGPVPIQALAPMASLLRATTPKISIDPVEQAKWADQVNAMELSPESKQRLIAAGYERGRQALGVSMGQNIPLSPDVLEQKLKLRTEPTVISIGGRKELADIQHGYKLTEQEQQAVARATEEEKKRGTAGFVAKAKKDAVLASEYDKQRPEVDHSIAATERLRDLAAQVTTGVLSGSDFIAKARQTWGDTDIALFDQYLAQAALPSLKPMVGGTAVSDADRQAVLSMFAGRQVPQAANLKALDAALQALYAQKRAMAASTNYFAQLGHLGQVGKQVQIPKSTQAPKGDTGSYIGTTTIMGKPGYEIYENFGTGKRYVKTPDGQWGDYLDPDPPTVFHELK